MRRKQDMPVYLFTGFLEAGKTRFIQETLEDKRFCNGEKTLLLVCEEGEEEYEPDEFVSKTVQIRTLKDQAELTSERLEALAEQYGFRLDTPFEQYPKDLNYYRIQGSEIDKKYIKTVEIYKEFLIINESFINTKTTADLKIPSIIKKLNEQDLEKIKSLIYLSTNDGSFERLFDTELF